ncbi:CDP-diacylglycerol--glycerol-3-phosphate 3-phosphatidyltransferase [Vibrio vulnificus]|uniref:CDP-diacylglycerol--glycerol-3-phosphate 3-phosphatidyltransferase n=1 Tax=Vibrio vulnificus TaxID=672 RepID=UPI00102960FF|nr:CDP-diacylglycerol--glycerol-3-phosphate 3-phosphatidyltransferase [Vibrio vulnificus]RZP78436.1 CDP-diacylglycerol--glycerol-3-phosphate 3-phosphatidyltransferase [Vibrio vulnificus]
MLMNLPNIFSLLRLLLIPVMIAFFYLPIEHAAAITSSIFFIAALTDLLDGYLARRLQQSSTFGAFIDLVADKVLVATALILITESYNSIFITLPAIIMIAREIIISALREWMAEVGRRSSVAVSSVGKFKTTFQMLSIWLYLLQPEGAFLYIAHFALLVATILTIWSMCLYLYQAQHDLLKDII